MGLFLFSLLTHHRESNVRFVFVLNSKLPQLSKSDKELLYRLKGEIIEDEFLIRDDGIEFKAAASINRKKLDALLRLHFSDVGIDKNVFLIPAVFSNEIYPVFPSRRTANIMLFHDLIPYLYSDHYFSNHDGKPRRDYAQRFKEVYRTDLFVTNSKTTADDLTVHFGVDPSRIAPILGAGASRAHLKPKMPAALNDAGDFVLMPSGDDFRKNNQRAVSAFSMLETNTKLVLPSKFSPESRKQLTELCPNVIFVGSVSDEEFLWLLKNAKFVFFPTEYEGLGMPLLEAVECDAVVACSNIPVFVEISKEGFSYFDPKSQTSMRDTLAELLEKKETSAHKVARIKLYRAIEKRFSWDISTDLFVEAIERVVANPPRKQLAVLCPSPSSYSAIGKYTFQLHSELARYYEIDYFVENGLTPHPPTRPNILEFAANYYPAHSFHAKRNNYEKVLYQIGNSEFHVETILEALRNPASAIIHDTMLNGIFEFMVNRGFIPSERREFEKLLDEKSGSRKSSCATSLSTNQQVLFSHSSYAANALAEIVGTQATQVVQVHLPVGVPQVILSPRSEVVISFAGIISEDKGIRLVSDTSAIKDVFVRVFGFGVLGDSPLLQNVANNVEVIKNLSDKEFQDALRESDVLVNYRLNYHGETSLSTLEAMRYGVAVIVNDVGWYAELPDDVVVKVKSESEVIEAIRDMAANPDKRRLIGEKARAYLQKNYTYAQYAQSLAEAMEGYK